MSAQTNFGRFVAVVAILAGTLGASRLTDRSLPEALARDLSVIPSDIAGWRSDGEAALPESVLTVLKPSSYLSRRYLKNGQSIDLFIAYYAQQRAGETMHSPKHCLPGGGWQIWDYSSAEIPTKKGFEKINKYYIQNAGRRAVVLYWYQSKRRIIASEYLGKLLLIRDSVLEGKTGAGIVRITCSDQPDVVQEALRFASDLVPAIQSLFPSE
jgi:EpsI family protein